MAHRNPSVPPTVTSEAAINDSAVHEIDVTRWLLGEEITAVMVLAPRRSSLASAALQDPMVVMFRTASGLLVDDELGLNVRYGYDIRAEVVGETGQARLAVPAAMAANTYCSWVGPQDATTTASTAGSAITSSPLPRVAGTAYCWATAAARPGSTSVTAVTDAPGTTELSRRT